MSRISLGARAVGVLLLLAAAGHAYGADSSTTIVEAEGIACMGYDKSRRQCERDALDDGKRRALEQAATYIDSEASYEDALLKKDILNAYAKGTVRILQTISSSWFTDDRSGDCYRIKVRAEVTPDEEAIEKAQAGGAPPAVENPVAPLTVKVWTDKESYREGEFIKVYLKGNRAFYARLVYTDAAGNLVQLLPNAHRTSNFFQSGTVYEVPTRADGFAIRVQPPFGREMVTLYASTAQVGSLNVAPAGDLYVVQTDSSKVADRTREADKKVAQFSESSAQVVTSR